jgi:hypothetical protein
MGSSLFPIANNIFIELRKITTGYSRIPTNHKPTKCFRYVNEVFVISTDGSERLQEFPHHINGLRPTLQFTMEVKTNNTLPFLHILATKRGKTLVAKV